VAGSVVVLGTTGGVLGWYFGCKESDGAAKDADKCFAPQIDSSQAWWFKDTGGRDAHLIWDGIIDDL
jgi:hypothetical protein